MLHSTHISNCHRNDPDKRQPRRLPQEWPADQERYTEEITASDRAYHAQSTISIDQAEDASTNADQMHINHVGIDRIELVHSPYADPSQVDFSRNAAELTEAETNPDPGLSYSERTAKQTCDYHEGNKAAPNNNLFFEERSNPLSSKGN